MKKDVLLALVSTGAVGAVTIVLILAGVPLVFPLLVFLLVFFPVGYLVRKFIRHHR